MMQKPCLWLKLSSPGKLLLDSVTLKVWSMQAAMQVFFSPWSSTVRYRPVNKQFSASEQLEDIQKYLIL